MRLKPLALGLALGLLGALFMLVITFYPPIAEAVLGASYGEGWRAIMMDTYPYYDFATWYGVILGIVFGFVDAFVFGALLGFLYNAVAGEE